MDGESKLQDWYLRYGFILDKRSTDKQKEKFIRSLITDIMSINMNLKTDQFRLSKKGEEYTNIYIGDVEKADQIICTYYDTPSLHLGGYRFFDKDTNRKNTLIVNFLLAILWLILGIILIVYVAVPIINAYGVANVRTILLAVVFIIYFFWLNKFARGIDKRKNIVRNSSSILSMLDFMESNRNKQRNKVAYAFLDSGVTNDQGLEKLKEISKGKILYLDAIGSENGLYLVSATEKTLNKYPNSKIVQKEESRAIGNGRVSFLISAQYEKEFYLNRNEIYSKNMNLKNLAVVSAYLKETVR